MHRCVENFFKYSFFKTFYFKFQLSKFSYFLKTIFKELRGGINFDHVRWDNKISILIFKFMIEKLFKPHERWFEKMIPSKGFENIEENPYFLSTFPDIKTFDEFITFHRTILHQYSDQNIIREVAILFAIYMKKTPSKGKKINFSWIANQMINELSLVASGKEKLTAEESITKFATLISKLSKLSCQKQKQQMMVGSNINFTIQTHLKIN